MSKPVLTDKSPEGNIQKIRKGLGIRLTSPLARLLVRLGVSPDAVTWAGFFVAGLSAFLAANGYFLFSGISLIFAGLFDILDGTVARISGKVTKFGAALDSTLDRLSEAVLLLGIMVFFLRTEIDPFNSIMLISLTLVGSYLVSYIRARAEGLGVACEVGISTRPERVAITALGLIVNQIKIALIIVVVMSFITAGQRLLYIWQKTRNS